MADNGTLNPERLAQIQTQNKYISDLQAELRKSGRIDDPDFALAKDPDFYKKLRREWTIAHALQYRQHLVAGPDYFLEAPDEPSKALLPYFDALIKQVQRFSLARFHLAEAFLEGMKVMRITGRFKEMDLLGDGNMARWYVVERLRDTGKQRYGQEWEWIDGPSGGRMKDWYWTRWDTAKEQWLRLDNPEYFVWHRYDDDEESLNFGRGLSEALYYLHYAITHLVEWALDGAERWSRPWIMALLDIEAGGAGLTGTDPDSFATIAQQYVDFLEKTRGQHVSAIDKRHTIDLKEPTGRGHEIITKLIADFKNDARILILGSNLPTSAVTGGSFALAEVQENSTEALIRFDRCLMEESLSEWLIGGLWRWNQPTFEALGLSGLRPPMLRIHDGEKVNDAERIQAIQAAVQIGLPIKKSEVYAAYGLTPPDQDDDILEPKVAQPLGPFRAPGTGLAYAQGWPY